METTEDTAPQIIRDLAIATQKPELTPTGNPMVSVVKFVTGDVGLEYKVLDLEKFMTVPSRIREKVELGDADSFILYVTEFKAEASPLIFFDDVAGAFNAVMDYSDPDAPRWGDHAASFALRHTPEWKAWAMRHGKEMSQDAFLSFMEDHADEIVSPKGGELLDIIMNFQETKSATFKNGQRFRDGSVRFQYTEEVKSDSVTIPNTFDLSLAVYVGQQPRPMEARIRYAVKEGKLNLWFDLLRWERIVREAQMDMISAVRVGTSLPVFLGKRNPLTK